MAHIRLPKACPGPQESNFANLALLLADDDEVVFAYAGQSLRNEHAWDDHLYNLTAQNAEFA